MGTHTKRSPSQGKRMMNCSGALALCDALPEYQKNIAGIAAKIGTATHGVIEHCLGKGLEPEELRGRYVELIGDEEKVSILKPGAKQPRGGRVFFECDDDMISGATTMTDYVRKRMKELKLKPTALQLETRTNPLPDRDDTSGTADVTLDAWPTLLEVVDYKNGWNIVEAQDNEQLLAYLLGKALESDFGYEEYQITIVQPNAPHEEGHIRPFTATKMELQAFQKHYRKGIERTEEAERAKNAPVAVLENAADVSKAWADKYLKAGDWCMFCDGKVKCSKYINQRQEDAKMDFADEPTELDEPKNEADAARILAWAPYMDKLVSAAALYGQRALENGFKVEGFKLVRKKTNRVLVEEDESVLVIKITKQFGLKRDVLFHPATLKSGPQIEKLIPAKRRGEFNDKFLFKPEGELTIAPDADPRPAVERNAGDDFNDAPDNDFDFE